MTVHTEYKISWKNTWQVYEPVHTQILQKISQSNLGKLPNSIPIFDKIQTHKKLAQMFVTILIVTLKL